MADNVLDLTQFKTTKELQDFANKQFSLIIQMKKEIDTLKQFNNDLKAQLLHLGKTQDILVSDEETVCEMELGRLRDTSLQRTLTLEETKKFDIISKSLNVIKANKKQETKKSESIPVDKLLEIVVNNEQE